MSTTPPEVHHEEFERTDALPRLDLNVLADATPINSDLLTRTDTWRFEVLQDLHWPHQLDIAALGSRPSIPRVDTSSLRAVEDDCTDMIAPLELGFADSAENLATRTLSLETTSADPLAVQQIAATLERDIVLFAAEHTASIPVGAIEPQLEKAHALQSLRELAMLLDSGSSNGAERSDCRTADAKPVNASSNEPVVEESITWMEMPHEYAPSNMADGAQELQRLLKQGQTSSVAQARELALRLMDGNGFFAPNTPAIDVATPELDPRSLVRALFPKSQQQQGELLAARQMIEEMRDSNELLQQAIASAQQRVEYLKTEVQRHTEIADARDSQLATSIEELTSRRLAMRELERVIYARDELIAGLRAELEAVRIELQTARDERGIMALNLGKSRERAKVLRQQLLERNTTLQNLHADAAERTQTMARQNGEAALASLPDRLLVPIDHAGGSIALDRPTITIGRTSQTDICISSTLISRQHARLIVSADAVVIEDLDSTNGCFVNDRRIQKKMVREGDILTLADMKYRLSQRNPEGMLAD